MAVENWRECSACVEHYTPFFCFLRHAYVLIDTDVWGGMATIVAGFDIRHGLDYETETFYHPGRFEAFGEFERSS